MKFHTKSNLKMSILVLLITVIAVSACACGTPQKAPQPLSPNSSNTLIVGDTGRIVLKGNLTTGYSWNYKIEGDEIVKIDEENAVAESEAAGAASTYTWNVKAVKAGQARIIFKYYRSFAGEESAKPEDTMEYPIEVKAAK